MHSAIFAVEIPNTGAWQNVKALWGLPLRSDQPSALDDKENVRRLAENVWQVNFQTNPAALATLIYGAEKFGLAYKILPLADAPQWLPGGLGSSTILDRRA
jgi:hypothetical protein